MDMCRWQRVACAVQRHTSETPARGLPSQDPVSDLVHEALSAYSRDPSYAIAMARQAQTIISKRRVWAVRLELREAERRARAACASDPEPFTCHVRGPCGVGVCPYAPSELSSLVLPPEAGRTSRPRSSSQPTYSIEQAVRPLLERRARPPLQRLTPPQRRSEGT